jgi:integrase
MLVYTTLPVLATMCYSFRHLLAYFGENTKAVKLGFRLDAYVDDRRQEGAAEASIRMELALLDRAFKLAVQKRLISHRARPYIEKPAEDPMRVRKGFFTRNEIEALSERLPEAVADLVLFLFFAAWRVGEARRLEWKHYFPHEQAIRLPAELSKNKHARALPVTGELATIIDRRLQARRLDCPYIFHRNGRRIGDFRKLWKRACAAIGLDGRIVHDLRRSGVKHLIEAGNDPHVVMAFSGHRTSSMLRRYHIIDLNDLRAAAERGSRHRGPSSTVTPLCTGTATEEPQSMLPGVRS